MAEKAAKPLAGQDWDHVMQDFGRDAEQAQRKWMALYPGHGLLDQALLSISKKELLPLKLQLCVFIEENGRHLIGTAVQSGLSSIVDAARALLHAPLDGNAPANAAVKEQMMVTATVVAIDTDALHTACRETETLVELLLGFITRTNYAPERHVRAVACECLRELELAYPCLLHAGFGHVFNLCQADRTHVGQSYALLLTTIVRNLCQHMFSVPAKPVPGKQTIVSTAVPLVPFSVPPFLLLGAGGGGVIPSRELTTGGLKEFRRVVAFLLERPDLLTECGLLEFLSHLIGIARALDLHGSLLKNQFAGLSHAYSPVLYHGLLMMAINFKEAFVGDEGSILSHLILLSRDSLQPLPFRILSTHWLLGMDRRGQQGGSHGVMSLAPGLLYPLVFEPLALKAAKLNALAYCAGSIEPPPPPPASTSVDDRQSEDARLEVRSELLGKGIISVSAFKWLPTNSTETRLAIHLLNRFLTLLVPDSASPVDVRDIALFANTPLFKAVQGILLSMATDVPGLVPTLLSFTDRFLSSNRHKRLGDLLLHTFSDRLLPKLSHGVLLPAYFPLFERMAENRDISPRPIVQSISLYITDRVRACNGKGSWVMWIRGSQVLGICRILMAHQYSSRIYRALSDLLEFLTMHFPDLELRDSARVYLRMLMSVPGRKLRNMLNPREEQAEDSVSNDFAQFSTFLKSPPPPVAAESKKRKLRVAAYIVLSRVKPLTVPHSWSMVIYNAIESSIKSEQTNNHSQEAAPESEVTEADDDTIHLLAPSAFIARKEVPRVTDTETYGMLNILRQHFSNILDFRKGTGFKIRIPCELSFQGDVRLRLIEESDPKSHPPPDLVTTSVWASPQTWPALYAVVVCFSASGSYGPVPKLRIPLLPSARPSNKASPRTATGRKEGAADFMLTGSADQGIDSIGGTSITTDSLLATADDGATAEVKETAAIKSSRVVHSFVVELEPKQPVPTWVDAKVTFTDESGQTVRGQLDSIPVGFEDLFMVAPCSEDVGTPNEAQYRFDVFNALWGACGGPGKVGGETFLLKGGQTGVDIKGTESVKLLESPAGRLMDAIKFWLIPYVVAVSGISIVADTRSWEGFNAVIWQEKETRSSRPGRHTSVLRLRADDAPLEFSKDIVVAEPSDDGVNVHRGCFYILMFLPPRYHLLFKMEVSSYSTLVRIRTDHWPSLAFVDEYLEALIMVR